jgi:hypothetical protein
MHRLTLSLVTTVFSVCSLASDFGVTGLIDIPTARMSADGALTTTAAIQSRTNAYSITYQATPWLEATFRYTGYNDFFFYDRNYETKIRLWSEQKYLPQVAVGIRDVVGTGWQGSEYLVASKEVGNFDFTLGLGWGRLAGEGDFNNPLIQLSDKFSSRQAFSGEGGELSTGVFFSGKKVGFFGGLSYQPDALPVSLMLEYNQDQYNAEYAYAGVPRPSSHWNAAIKWQALPDISLSLSRQHGQDWGIELSAALDTKSLPPRWPAPRFTSSLDMAPQNLPPQINPRDWYGTLLYDVERSGLLLLEASIEPSSSMAILVMGNDQYPVWADAIAKMVVLADLHLPSSVNTFRIIAEEFGHRVQTIQMRRPSLAYGQSKQLVERQISVLPGRSLASPQRTTSFHRNKVFFDVGVAARVQLFDPDDPARYGLYTKISALLVLPKAWTLTGAYGVDITNNFDESNRASSGSVLPHVRSDVVKYLQQGDTGLDSLYIEKRGSAYKGLHYRVFGGVLEDMYSGFGGEVLYQPFQSRLAYGLSANWVRQRAYDKSFKHLDYQTATAFASVYWASPFYNFDVAVHAGKYLAKDVGATLEIRRTFNSGFMVGLWASMTDVSAEDFGEGSFDKGIFLKIPFDGLFGRNTRGGYNVRARPIQRDGGQRLEDFSANIWWDIRGARYDAFSDLKNRMVP